MAGVVNYELNHIVSQYEQAAGETPPPTSYIITNIITAMLPYLVAAALLFTVYALNLHATKSEAEKETETQEKEMQQETQPEPEDVFTEST